MIGARIAVLGGGVAGLAAAHYLVRAGHRPIVFEASGQLGGLGTHFEHDGVSLDRFYHVILDSDASLLGLIADVGWSDRLVWRETGMGFLVDGRLHAFNTPLDLLRFGALGLSDRVRTGLGAVYLTRVKRQALDLDRVRACEWLPRVFGQRVFERIWDPLLRAKFGDRRGDVPAYWVWNTLNREKNGAREVKGYLRSGYRGLAERLAETVRQGGGEVRTDTAVRSIAPRPGDVAVATSRGTEIVDAVISTLPMPLLRGIAHGRFAAAVPLERLQYQGVVNVLVVSRRPLERFYWTAVVDPRFPFQGIVETTHVIPTEWTGGRHLYYLMNYCAAESALYARSEDALRRDALAGLRLLYPRFDPGDVEAVYVFRAPHVEPVWTVGYLTDRPGPRAAPGLYLCTTAQAYPRVTAWNTSVALARETVEALCTDMATLRDGGDPERRLAE